MSMSAVNPHGPSAEMNVTPLIDVLLVLLIIFMVITPLTPNGLEALVPQPPDKITAPPVQPRTVVVQVRQDDSLQINGERVSWEIIESRLRAIFAARAERVVFIKGDDAVEFEQIAQVIDAAHGAGIDHVALLTTKIEVAH